MNPHLERLAKRVEDDPAFLAAALKQYADSEELNPAGLAGRLGCPARILPQIYLCLMPRTNAPHFRQDIEQIASRFALDADVLAEAVRHGQSVIHMRQPAAEAGRPASLVAARRRQEPPPSQASKGDTK
jgi:hypothetical protein